MVLEVTRRQFLLVNAAAGLAALSQPLLTAVLGPELTAEQRNTLLLIAKTLFPHEHADEKLYANAVRAIEMRCRTDADASRVVTKGINAVAAACADRSKCASVLESMRGSEFFRLAYAEALESVYGAPETWDIFAGRVSASKPGATTAPGPAKTKK
jgi:hypothetical protein